VNGKRPGGSGLLKPGPAADLVIFDPNSVPNRAIHKEPHQIKGQTIPLNLHPGMALKKICTKMLNLFKKQHNICI